MRNKKLKPCQSSFVCKTCFCNIVIQRRLDTFKGKKLKPNLVWGERRVDWIMYDTNIFIKQMKNSLWHNVSYFCSVYALSCIDLGCTLSLRSLFKSMYWSEVFATAERGPSIMGLLPLSLCLLQLFVFKKPAERKLRPQPFFNVTVLLTSHWQTQSLALGLIHSSIHLISAYNLSSAALSLSQDIVPLRVSFLPNTQEFLLIIIHCSECNPHQSFIMRSFMFTIPSNQSLSAFAAQVAW